MIINVLLYSDWKSKVVSNSLSYISEPINSGLIVYAFDGQATYVHKPTLADLTDYNATMKAGEATRVGNQIDPLNYTANLYYRGTGIINGVALAQGITNLDYIMPADRKINGTQIILQNHAFGDSLKFQVVHPQSGILDEFATNWYVSPDKNDQGIIKTEYPAQLYTGLIIRLVYNSVGSTNVKVLCNATMHEG